MALDSNNRESDKITNDFESLKDLLMQTTKVIVNYKDKDKSDNEKEILEKIEQAMGEVYGAVEDMSKESSSNLGDILEELKKIAEEGKISPELLSKLEELQKVDSGLIKKNEKLAKATSKLTVALILPLASIVIFWPALNAVIALEFV